MTRLVTAFLAWFVSFFRSRHALGLQLAAAVGRSQTPELPTQVEPVGSPIRDDPPTPMVKMGTGAGHREAGDSREPASRRVPVACRYRRKRGPFWRSEGGQRGGYTVDLVASRTGQAKKRRPCCSQADLFRLATSFGPFRRFNLAHLGMLLFG